MRERGRVKWEEGEEEGAGRILTSLPFSTISVRVHTSVLGYKFFYFLSLKTNTAERGKKGTSLESRINVVVSEWKLVATVLRLHLFVFLVASQLTGKLFDKECQSCNKKTRASVISYVMFFQNELKINL